MGVIGRYIRDVASDAWNGGKRVLYGALGLSAVLGPAEALEAGPIADLGYREPPAAVRTLSAKELEATTFAPSGGSTNPFPPDTYLVPIEEKVTLLCSHDSPYQSDFYGSLTGTVVWEATGEPLTRDYWIWAVSTKDWQPVGAQKIMVDGIVDRMLLYQDARTPEYPPRVDEGVWLGEEVLPIAYNWKTGQFFWGEFAGGPLSYQGAGIDENRTILVTSRPVPEPSTMVSLAFGAGLVAAACRKKR